MGELAAGTPYGALAAIVTDALTHSWRQPYLASAVMTDSYQTGILSP